MNICFVNCRKNGADETLVLRDMMYNSNHPQYKEVLNPKEADLILITGILELDTFRDLRLNEVWRKYPNKSFGYSEVDNVPTFLHGVYASACCTKGIFNRMQSCGYPTHRRWKVNPPSIKKPFYNYPKKYLFSFIGRNTSTVRKKIFRFPWMESDVMVLDISGKYDHFSEVSENRKEMQFQYWKSFSESKYILCPKGQGASSIRIFEAMECGIAPVIISDKWVPSYGPTWDKFAIFIPENKIHQTHEILKSHENEWMERGKLAEEAYKNWFSEERSWDQLMGAIQVIKNSQNIPEQFFVNARGVIYILESANNYFYNILILLKNGLRILKLLSDSKN